MHFCTFVDCRTSRTPQEEYKNSTLPISSSSSLRRHIYLGTPSFVKFRLIQSPLHPHCGGDCCGDCCGGWIWLTDRFVRFAFFVHCTLVNFTLTGMRTSRKMVALKTSKGQWGHATWRLGGWKNPKNGWMEKREHPNKLAWPCICMWYRGKDQNCSWRLCVVRL